MKDRRKPDSSAECAGDPPRTTLTERGSLAGARAYWGANQKMRFMIVGGWNTLFGYLCFVVLYAVLHRHLHYLLIGVLAHATATVHAFVAHRFFVFRSREPWFGEFVRFNISLLFVMGYAIAALWLLVEIFHLDPVIAQGLVTVVSVVFSYVAHRRFSFAAR